MDIALKIQLREIMYDQVIMQVRKTIKNNIQNQVSIAVNNQVWEVLAQNIYFSIHEQIFEQFILYLNPNINRGYF